MGRCEEALSREDVPKLKLPERNSKVYRMSKFNEKGYFVKENAPIYLTMDMDKTAKWFDYH